jgi:putative adhesin
MTRHVVFVVVGVALIAFGVAVLVGCGAGCSVNTWHSDWSDRTVVDGVELPHAATLKASAAQPLPRLVLDFRSAGVVVQGDASVKGVEAEYEVREKAPGDASIAIGSGGIEVKSASGNPVLVTSARIRVPPGTPVHVTTSVGRVKVSGIRGVDEVTAKTDSGEVELESLADVAKLVAESGVGRIALTDASGVASISLTSNAGEVSARDVAGAKDVALNSHIGGVRAESVEASGSLRCEADTGEVDARDVKTKDCRLRSDVGAVRATRCAVDKLYAHTDVGAVQLESCTYESKDVGSDLGGVSETK